MKRSLLPAAVATAGLLAFGAFAAFAASTTTTIRSGDQLRVTCEGTKLSITRVNTKEVVASCKGLAATPTRTSTAAAPTKTPTTTPTKTPTVAPTSTPTSAPTATPTTPPGGGGSSPMIGNCSVFPADNAWNMRVDSLPIDSRSSAYVASINSSGGNGFLHADFGSDPTYGIPYVVVPGTQPMVPIVFNEYGDESDPGPYPVPLNAPVEAGGDKHVLVVQQDACKLYELYHAVCSGAGWSAGSGAVFDLRSNALRPDGWTSADAAGLPILPGLVRYEEVAAGRIDHALRFTVSRTQRGYIHPATHFASSSTDPNLPPMGLRLRLKPGFDISGYHGQARVILEALKTYGMIVADNGSSWFITGATDSRWNDDDLDQLKTVPGSAFEAVTTGSIQR